MQKLIVTPTPHIFTPTTVSKTMLNVIYALLPAAVVSVYFFGLPALLLILISVTSCVVFEAAYQKLAKKPIAIGDFSAVITGLLLAFTLPPGIPLWMPVVGSFFAIVVVKQIFGGLGHNFLNPALVGRGVLTVSFTHPLTSQFVVPMSGWTSPDIISSPTPLVQLNTHGIAPTSADYIAAPIGNQSGSLGEVAAVALLLGGLFLIATKTITWHIPAGFIGTVFLLTLFLHPEGISNSHAAYQILLGGLFLGAFFMATDYPTSPMTNMGKLIFGIGCGTLTAVFRLFSAFPEGVLYAILLMNLTVPLIDRFIRPRVFGTKASD